jgi:hypothetical protein
MMNKYIACITVLLLLSLSETEASNSRYQFSFHHYNDIYSYSQAFSLPSQGNEAFFWHINAAQDARNNLTLAKEEDRYLATFGMGIQPWHFAGVKLKERISQNRMETKDMSSRIAKNEFTVETPLAPRPWMTITPYFISMADRYTRTPEDSFSISNPGIGRGIKGALDLPNAANVETELAFVNQEISSEKRACVDASVDRIFKGIRVGGNFDGKNIVTHYPILQGREEKFLESAHGDCYADFTIAEKLTSFLRYEGNYQNEIYSLLEGFGGKHNNEKRRYHTIASTISCPVNSRLSIDISLEGYQGEKLYQDGINDETSVVKTIAPALTFRPHRNSRMTIKHTTRLSSFSFPNPISVTDRDILEKSISFMSYYTLPNGTDLSLSLGRTENHIIYIRSEMSANNVKRTNYSLEAIVSHFVQQIVKIEERFSLVSNYQLYDFSSQRNFFARNLSHQSKLNILVFQALEPSARFQLIKQDWGPYLYSYEPEDYLFYRNMENRKETFEFALEIKPWTLFSLTPSYMLVRNNYKNFLEITGPYITTSREEHIGAEMQYRANENKILDFSITWIKRNAADDFFQIKARITYSV